MPKPASASGHPVSAPVVIAIEGITAGLALRERSRFRFFSGHPRFDLLDGSRFSHVKDVQWAVNRLAHATQGDSAVQPLASAQANPDYSDA